MQKLPERKNLRLRGFDYSSQGSYFVTICTKDKQNLFWTNNEINEIGKIVENHIIGLSSHYFGVKIDNYAIMPNHIHVLVTIGCDALPENDEILLNNIYNKYSFPNLKVIIGGLKSGITKDIHKSFPRINVWQRGYHDHIINNLNDYNETWDYIENNPNVWIAKTKENRFEN